MTRARCGIAWLQTLRHVGAMRMVVLGLAMALGGCAGYTPGDKAYWDAKVREMCAKDGGVRILERMRLSPAELKVMRHSNGRINVLMKDLAPPEAPAYAVLKRQYIRQGNPEISRVEGALVRRKDEVVVAKWVMYGRFGGDFPSHAHPSSFGCPDPQRIASDLEDVFVIEGEGG